MAEKIDKSMAIVGLILNIVIIPGLGTLIGGGPKYKTQGIWQLVVSIVAWICMVVMFVSVIGILFGFLFGLVVFAMWIWALVTGIKMVQEAK